MVYTLTTNVHRLLLFRIFLIEKSVNRLFSPRSIVVCNYSRIIEISFRSNETNKKKNAM